MNAFTPIEQQFAAAIAAHGFVPKEITGDGKIHRFDGPEDKPGKKSAWYVLHIDQISGAAFGDWKIGFQSIWCSRDEKTFTPEERAAWLEQRRAQHAAIDAERRRAQGAAAKKAIAIWRDALDATPQNPYCVRKGVEPFGLKEFRDKHTLIVPIRTSAGALVSLQFIYEDGSKRFLTGGEKSGCYCLFGGVPTDRVLIVEGFATGASLHAATGIPVAVAFDAGNLPAVAARLRDKLPACRLILCADDDAATPGNPGITKATEAARLVGGALAVPDFGDDRPEGATDFNDLHQARGLDVVSACIEAARSVEALQEPASPVQDARTRTRPSDAAAALRATVNDAIQRTIDGDAGALFDIAGTLRELRADYSADYARARARIRHDCRDVKISELERQMRSDVNTGDEKSVADMLIDLADERCELFHDPDRAAYALLDGGGHRQCWPVRSEGFREWMAYSFYQLHGRAPTDLSIVTALATIEGKAKFDGEEWRTQLRVAAAEGSVWIDLCNDAWQAVEVTATGWRVVDAPPIRFTRTSTMRALPMPTTGGSLAPLWDVVNIPESERLLVLTWLLECFRSATPYAVLELTGEQGSAKSTTQFYLRELIDPNRSNNRGAPKSVDDVFIAAQNAHLMSFENLSHLAPAYQDALCVLATGGGYSTRRLYTNTEESVIDTKRPIVLNGIAIIVTAQDLSDRAVHVDLPTIEARATANQIEQTFAVHRSGIFGALLDALARALAELQSVRAEDLKLPRMADFAQLGEAVYRTHGRAAGEFLREYQDKRRENVNRTIEASPVGAAMLAYLEVNPDGFRGTVGHLLDKLLTFRQDAEAWPKSAKGMGDAFRRLAPALRQIGVEAVASTRRGRDGCQCSLKWIEPPEGGPARE